MRAIGSLAYRSNGDKAMELRGRLTSTGGNGFYCTAFRRKEVKARSHAIPLSNRHVAVDEREKHSHCMLTFDGVVGTRKVNAIGSSWK